MKTTFGKKIFGIGLFTALVLGGTAGFVVPARAAPAFNTFPVSFTPQTDKDLPLVDARNITQNGAFSSSQSDHDNGVSAAAGDLIEFQIYYHNGAATAPENIAHNVIVKANLPGGSRSAHEVAATIDSDETSPVTSADSFRGGNITIHISGEPQTLELVAGSVKHFPNRSQTGVAVSGGDNIAGSGVNIGDVQGCFEFSGFVNFRARVGSQQPPSEQRDLSIDKRVLNVTKGESVFVNSTNASPSDRVKFEIRVQTSGNVSQNEVIVRDILPVKLTRVTGTLRQDGSQVTQESDFFGSGINLGTLSAGVSRVFTFEATVAAAGAVNNLETITNTANVRSNQVGTKQDDASVVVQQIAGIQFAQRKTAFNLTRGVDAQSITASPGDVITYTLFFKNTGQAVIPNVVIEDNIHDILELAQITNQGDAVSVNSVIRWAPVDVQGGVEIAKTFQVRVKDASLIPANSDLLMVNIYGNEIRIPVRVVRGVTTPPRTGPGEWLMGALAAMSTFGYWVYRKRKTGPAAV